MHLPYAIQVDAARSLLTLVFAGVWTDGTFDAFERDLDAGRARMEAAGLSPDWRRVLIDATGFAVQTRAVAERFGARVQRFHADRRLAFLGAPGQLSLLQYRRLAASEDHRFFADRAEALAWLFEEVAIGGGEAHRAPA